MAAVVVGYVAKPEGEAAVEQGILEARLRQASLVVVSSSRTPSSGGGSEPDLSALEATLEQSGLAYDVRRVEGSRDPAEDLIGAAEASDAELIVIGLRRRSPVGKLILGSSAQRILLDAPCPVLAVKVG
jgi:nucleotide-binding universal stress UspA family protein